MPDTIKIVGLAHLKAALSTKAEELTRGAHEAVAAEVEEIKDDARRHAPRHTGELRRRIDGEAEGPEGSVRSTSRHAGFVEHGTYKDKAQPYMRPAAERARRRIPKRAASIIRAALGG